jgi:glutathione synthase/RimK-type ligase-like ATP-grasp enzyme
MLDVVVLYEHPEWQKPLFAALERRGVAFAAYDLKAAAFTNDDVPAASVYYSQASPSAYVRGNTRAVPYALALMRALELAGARVLNGADVFAFELSKSAQAMLMRRIGVPTPKTLAFNHIDALRARAHEMVWPALLKPEQGGSGARIELVNDAEDVARILEERPETWLPDNLLLVQEYVPASPERGIVRLEFVGGELLYPMRVVSHGRFNLCPAPVCNPEDGEAGACEIPTVKAPPVEFYPYPEVPPEAVEMAKRIVRAAKLDVGGIEYLDGIDGRRVFYDVNANSNLRPSIAQAFGFDPFERVVDFLVAQVEKTRSARSA